MKWIYLAININCYSKAAHNYLGKLSDNYLKLNNPLIYDKILSVLNYQSISSVSSWADQVKRTKQYSWSRTLHYIDILVCQTNEYNYDLINKYCKNSCIISTLNSFVDELKTRQKYKICGVFSDRKISDEDLLKFIIHFMEDFVQPMHLLGYQRGGNSLKINVTMPNKKFKKLNLHQLWDSLIPDYYIKMYSPEFYFDVMKPVDYSEFMRMQFNQNVKISCLIYPGNTNIVFDDYFNKTVMDTLFKNYHTLSIGTYKYIFE